ncbi:metallophosphoesterase family protein [Streptomyces sp. DT203]|uniref:metallophosphoesterase family protein n=1 Tax=Streptomyces sp. DT203 TaxID=3393424 RepID=UPI003CEC2B60
MDDPRRKCADRAHPHLWAVSDLHVGHPVNRSIADGLAAQHPDDWLLVAGDVAESSSRTQEVLAGLRSRFRRVIWTPGNHELWTHPRDEDQSRGVERYAGLVEKCRKIEVLTPEDEYVTWRAPEQELVIAPVHLLYDYSFRDPGTDLDSALEAAWEAGHVFSDELLLHPDPYPTRQEWCHARVASTEKRLADLGKGSPIIVVNHYPLIEEPVRRMFSPHLAMWCGTRLTSEWHKRFPIHAVVHGHLHMPRSSVHDGVAVEEVSLGYPREWGNRETPFAPRLIACGVSAVGRYDTGAPSRPK